MDLDPAKMPKMYKILQMKRNVQGSGEHSHNLHGDSQVSRASLTNNGGNQAHENRPLYSVIQYIIYISD